MTLVEQLIRDEAKRNKPYRDSVGKLTVGVGHNLDDKPLSDAVITLILKEDISDATADLKRALPWTNQLDDARFGALVNMTFNMGIGGLLQFKKALAAIQTGAWDIAAAEMLHSKWAEQVGPRAHRLAKQMQTGEWQ